MKYYKDKDNNIFAFEADGSQDEFISDDLIAITQKEAEDIIQKKQEADVEAYIPDTLSRFQMLSILRISKLDSGESMYQVVDGFIKDLPEDTSDNIVIKTAWDTAPEFRRDSLLVIEAQKKLNLTDAEADELFKKGAKLST